MKDGTRLIHSRLEFPIMFPARHWICGGTHTSTMYQGALDVEHANREGECRWKQVSPGMLVMVTVLQWRDTLQHIYDESIPYTSL